ncbi:MAG: hypothetical protein HOM68_13520 [Gemmatimonadetes bacterium]|jgi:glycerophosphoryl diester phosphodiesterase|nr:hypothetical protein [Gemmatimonadota bacterium]MBT5057556.1 hypothetical protein [Gemmatimonadota bacterium]MBT5146291.1 hypothetical protein [Gemmatimonadota bacterium]MBT5591214.1 hypothetical protein [Gemmatimonadota bacterium]MBT5962331.1 hypothetical protein [Gemmatimonadota bacterium]
MSLPSPFRIIAHRGASGYAPENTMAAFRAAMTMSVTEIETDVHFSRDRQLLLLHDDTLERTTNGKGRPGDFDLEELKSLDAGSWADPEKNADLAWTSDFAGESLITLDELFAEFGARLTYHVELKDPEYGVAEAVAESVGAAGLATQTFVTGFERSNDLLRARSALPGLRTTPLIPTSRDPGEAIATCADEGHDGVSIHIDAATTELVEIAHGAGLEIRCWGVRTRESMASGAACGINGMTINWPDWLQEWAATESSRA